MNEAYSLGPPGRDLVARSVADFGRISAAVRPVTRESQIIGRAIAE